MALTCDVCLVCVLCAVLACLQQDVMELEDESLSRGIKLLCKARLHKILHSGEGVIS